MSPEALRPDGQAHGMPVELAAVDGTALGGTLFEPEAKPHTALVVGSATGVHQRFYARFARHAAGRGFVALTFDYRGIGKSAPHTLRGYAARYRDWGQRDIPGALDWLSDRYPGLPLTFVGHSTGGQQLGLAPNVQRLQAAVFVAVSTGYWAGMALRQKWLTLALWTVYVPITSRLWGYAPAKRLQMGEDLPAGVAREWGSWCLEPDYLAAYFDEDGRRASLDGAPFGPVHFDDVAFPIRAYCFTDDPIATRANVPPLLSLYTQADVDIRWVSPRSVNARTIGHLGFFRSRVGASLWDEALDWLGDPR